MFVLLGVKDTIPVHAKASALPPALTIQDALNKKYANKLISGKGLALSVYDILTAEDGRVTWGNGQMYFKVMFRLLLFAPFVGEVIVGTVCEVKQKYIRVSLEFFKDIYIPSNLLPPNCAFDRSQQTWFWYTPEDDSQIMTENELLNTLLDERMHYEVGQPIRFRVDSVEWQDIRPEPAVDDHPAVPIGAGADSIPEKDPYEKAGFKILGTVADSGLGMLSWWGGDE